MGGLQESRTSPARIRSARARQFSLTSFREAQHVVIRACGRLILGHGADQDLWAAHIKTTPATNVALDLACVKDVDAQGLGVLADLVRQARERGTNVSVIAASRVVRRLAEMTRLDQVLPGTSRLGVPECRPPLPCPS
jgi:anti-anti-sigma factor